MTLIKRVVPVVAVLVATTPAWAGVLDRSQTVTIDALTGSANFTIPAFTLPGQALSGVMISLSGGATIASTATNASPDFSNFVTAGFTVSYLLSGPGGLSASNTIATSGASGAVARAGTSPATLLLSGAGTAAPVVFTVPVSLLSLFQGPADVPFSLASTGLSAATSCVVLKPYNVRDPCGLPGDSFGVAAGIDTVTTKLSYAYDAIPGYVPPSPPSPPAPVPVPVPTPLAVPEPGSLAVLGVGMIGLGLLRRRAGSTRS